MSILGRLRSYLEAHGWQWDMDIQTWLAIAIAGTLSVFHYGYVMHSPVVTNWIAGVQG